MLGIGNNIKKKKRYTIPVVTVQANKTMVAEDWWGDNWTQVQSPRICMAGETDSQKLPSDLYVYHAISTKKSFKILRLCWLYRSVAFNHSPSGLVRRLRGYLLKKIWWDWREGLVVKKLYCSAFIGGSQSPAAPTPGDTKPDLRKYCMRVLTWVLREYCRHTKRHIIFFFKTEFFL